MVKNFWIIVWNTQRCGSGNRVWRWKRINIGRGDPNDYLDKLKWKWARKPSFAYGLLPFYCFIVKWRHRQNWVATLPDTIKLQSYQQPIFSSSCGWSNCWQSCNFFFSEVCGALLFMYALNEAINRDSLFILPADNHLYYQVSCLYQWSWPFLSWSDLFRLCSFSHSLLLSS